MAWHTRHDAGVSFANNALPLIARYPQYETEIRAWGGCWMEMFDGYIDGTPALIDRLEERACRFTPSPTCRQNPGR
jgi:2-haloacid dehalogenase